MKAIICTRYGPPEVLQPAEVPKPVPLDDEVLIRIHATTCHIGDVRVRAAMIPLWMQLPFRLYMGILKPKRKILGMELAGVVEAVGKAVRSFKTGDAVLAFSGFALGGYAEYICLPEDAGDIRRGLVVRKPTAMSFAEAAAGLATGGLTALSMLRKADVRPGQRMLVYGASGSVGVYAVQLARHFGAEVTGVCSTGNLALVRSLGASVLSRKYVVQVASGFSRLARRADEAYREYGEEAQRSQRRKDAANCATYLRDRTLVRSSTTRGTSSKPARKPSMWSSMPWENCRRFWHEDCQHRPLCASTCGSMPAQSAR